MDTTTPADGQWPIDPQHEVILRDERIWIDGCFDFFHHGHAGVMLQARQLGDELWVGIHSDEAILEHKGPTVMNLKERVSAANACRWVTQSVPYAPYVTSLPWITHYGCRYVVHGDDITSDSSGEDCYRFVKQADRFKVVKRTPGISTTDLVGRMLLCTKNHFIRSLKDMLEAREGPDSLQERDDLSLYMTTTLRQYSTDETGLSPGVDVYFLDAHPLSRPHNVGINASSFETFYRGKGPRDGQRIIYVDGGFDLFSSGHVEFLRLVTSIEEEASVKDGWRTSEQTQKRRHQFQEDYSRAFVVAGIHNDQVINNIKGLNYPIMNIFERGLCLLQCKYIHSVIFGAPFEPVEGFLRNLPGGTPSVVYHGPTSFMPLSYDPYSDAKRMGIFKETPTHDFQDVNASHVVDRITASRARFEERQRNKGVKAIGEEAVRQQELEAAKRT